jgi:predicted nucleic acid-binding protein
MWAKGLNGTDVYKEMCSVYGRKCFSFQAIHNWVEKFSQGRSKVDGYARSGAEVARQGPKNFYASGFDALVKRRDKCINVGVYVEK